jgi:predicted AlkP superfamily phosphohydrolase/phosphomutase
MRLVPALLVAAAAACCLSCAREDAEPLARRIVFLGIDGLEWDIAGPMIESGRLPNLARLVSEGAWGELTSLESLESPVIWTSIATGKLPEKHGITGFTAKPGAARDGAIFTADYREARTVWDILGEHGYTVGVVMWLVTWPPEPVNGYLVSDYIKYDWRHADAPQATTFPPELASELAGYVVRTDDIPDGSVDGFLRGGVPEDRELRARVRPLRSAVAVDEAALGIGLRLAREKPVDFFTVYFAGVDVVCHHYWVDAFPESGPAPSAREIEIFGEVVERYYEHADRAVGEFMELADEQTTVIVASDHGHSGPKPRGDGYVRGIAMHDPTGVLIFWGKDIAPGRELAAPTVLDITPTVLALYGLPVAADMDGRVLKEAIDPGFARSHRLASTETYERSHAAETDEPRREPGKSPVDEEARERLRSLGYIE